MRSAHDMAHERSSAVNSEKTFKTVYRVCNTMIDLSEQNDEHAENTYES
jgi:hypothetical protein